MKRFAPFLLACAALAALPGCSRGQALVRMQVLDLEQQVLLPTLPHRGRDYIEGQPGHRYAVVLENLSGERVLAVVSVDGVNAISGQTAGSQQSGYVLGPWQRLEVRGWRKNLSEVAQFHFTSRQDSYAARTGRPDNVGVIGVAAFRERRTPPRTVTLYGDAAPLPPYSAAPQESRQGPSASDKAAASERFRGESGLAARQQLGTGHGERRWDAATATTFERASSRPDQVLTLWYDSTEALVSRGVLPRWPQPLDIPQAFPIGFAPDPG
jgi:hypothetical protein